MFLYISYLYFKYSNGKTTKIFSIKLYFTDK